MSRHKNKARGRSTAAPSKVDANWRDKAEWYADEWAREAESRARVKPAPLSDLPPGELAGARRSLRLSQASIRATLSIPCPQCATPAGVHCFGTHGFCAYRFDKGATLAYVPAPLEVGELKPLAGAARNVYLRGLQRQATTKTSKPKFLKGAVR